MHQARVTTWGHPPTYTTGPAFPAPSDGELRLRITHAGLHRVVRSRAAGSHYSATQLPHVPGIDGVGTTPDGRSVYFFSMTTGSFTEEVNVPARATFPLPEGLDPALAAAMVNPAMSGWMAFKARTTGELKERFSVVILGATSASGRLAALFARELGAGRVVGVARGKEAMEAMGALLDERVVVQEKVEETDFSGLGDVDVVVDYVYGPLAVHLLRELKSTRPVDYIHIGSLSGETDISLPGEVLRSKDIAIRGSGPGAWAIPTLGRQMPGLLEALKKVGEQPIKVVKLSEVESEWQQNTKERVVFTP